VKNLLLLTSIVAVAIVLAYWGLLFLMQRSMLFPAPAIAAAPLRPVDARQVWLATAAGRVEAWFLPARSAAHVRGPLIIFCHGNGELIDLWPAAFEEPRRWGVHVLLVEYPGYGRSPGQASEATTTQAVVAAYDWARGRPGIDEERIVAYGRSVGGGVACQLAARRPIAALVLESTFTSVRSLARRYLAPAILVREAFDNLAVVRQYRGPLLLLHGSLDDTIAPRHSRALAAAAHQAELHLLPCGHNDCPRQWPLVHGFLKRCGLLPPQSP
jgi:pimeloyl-ACP methyl ester carboxylesterase